ncbi:hypothetical protein [Fuchsiella alkaliacetigena]|uniref:hypothetical protein n=1 Tax=Fuchsiella alkaliacetigena TaxID=957042 RepID=UPI00200A996B|nr:hypothetical protein [Fuchsiella alkaliacetigena]MCK8825263.1 hypothetical protein [Fuchsiella alkaliacetigena]
MTDKEKLKKLLKELFRSDKADLDFGIYRIMNQKREEIEKFIEKDLVNHIDGELSKLEKHDEERLNQELEKVKQEAKELGVDYKETAKYKEIKKKINQLNSSKHIEANIYNEIYRFFKRYYDNGDFLSKRRYSKEEKYAIPYNGEEVYLHWANNDQYYVKTNEEFSNYSFDKNGIKVNFEIKEAQEDKNNNKSDEDRYFVLKEKDYFDYDEEDKVLNIYFEYRSLSKSEEKKYSNRNTQRDIREKTFKKLEKEIKDDTSNLYDLNWLVDDKNKSKSLLETHLYKYTTKNH